MCIWENNCRIVERKQRYLWQNAVHDIKKHQSLMRKIECVEFCDIPVYFIALCVKKKKKINTANVICPNC